MCKPASFVLTKDNVFWSKRTESHSEIIKEFNLCEEGVRGINLACVEITPPGDDYRLPLDQWIYRLDTDRAPHWYDAKEAEARVRAILPEWLKAKIILPDEARDVYGEEVIIACYGTVRAYGSSSVTACGSSSVTAYDSSSVTACDSSSVTACDSSSVTACDSSSVRACNSSSVRAYDSSSVTACGSSIVRAYDRSSVTACDSSIVRAYGLSSVRDMYNNAVVQAYHTIKPIIHSPTAVLIDRSVYGKVAIRKGRQKSGGKR
jgi:hypothetical protein